MVTFEQVNRLVELYRNGWLFKVKPNFLSVYLKVPAVFCTTSEVSTYDENQYLKSFGGMPAVIWKNGDAEWWNHSGNYKNSVGYLQCY